MTHLLKSNDQAIPFAVDGELEAVEIINPSGSSPIVLVCEHASNRIPDRYDSLGLPPSVLMTHIAWDIGAKDLAVQLASQLDARLVASTISRLVYDCNRSPDTADGIVSVSDEVPIIGNQDLVDGERLARIDEVYRPFEHALSQTIESHRQSGRQPIIVTIHSFTPEFQGEKRTVEIGLLHGRDSRLVDSMSAAESNWSVARNEPYGPSDGVLHTINQHGVANDFYNVMIEVRNDLLHCERATRRLAIHLKEVLVTSSLQLGFDDVERACTEQSSLLVNSTRTKV